MKLFYPLLLSAALLSTICRAQNVGINSQGALPHSSAMLDVSSTSSGFLMPRMTTAERDAIASPAAGLQIYNTTTAQVNTYSGTGWVEAKRSNHVLVKSLADLPAPVGTEIKLDANTLYEINGAVNISPYYLNLNGAWLKGGFAEKDVLMSNVAGAVLRSVDNHVFLEKITVSALSAGTSAYHFSDATADKICILHPSTAVVDFFTPSQGVGTISGFRLVALVQNYWRCQTGLKMGGNTGRFLFTFTQIYGVTASSGLELLPGLNAAMVDISNNHFQTTGVPGIKSSGGAVAIGRLHSNYFTNTAAPLSGFSKKDSNWWMSNNSAIADSRVLGMMHLASSVENAAITTSIFQVVKGNYAGSTDNERFTQTTDQLNYTGVVNALMQVSATMSVTPLANQNMTVEFEIRKNGVSIPGSQQIMVLKGSDTYMPITLIGVTELAPTDYIEVWGRSPAYTGWKVEKMMLTVR